MRPKQIITQPLLFSRPPQRRKEVLASLASRRPWSRYSNVPRGDEGRDAWRGGARVRREREERQREQA
eukprot:760918-Hanusia_phi.AAC.1